MIFIGIDPGVKTGVAVWHPGKGFSAVESMDILSAVALIGCFEKNNVFVIVEDARKRKKFKPTDLNPSKYQGVGSVKRDCKIIEDFLIKNEIPHQMKHPRNTKIPAVYFKNLTGWQGRTNEHARDAAMLVFGMKNNSIIIQQ